MWGCLNVNPIFPTEKQKKRNIESKKKKAANKEVDKILATSFVREVSYPNWLVNVVLVKKHSGKWRMCIDYTDLNETCPNGYSSLRD